MTRFQWCIIAALTLVPAGAAAQAIDTAAKQAFMLDDETGTVLLEKNADERMHPSSMSKIMTVYMVFEQLKAGKLKLTDELGVSERAWRWAREGSAMFVDINSRIKIQDLLRGIIVQSGNDACVVVAEGLAGSEEAFAEQMNAKAKQLGLTGSSFRNATGWPDPQHLMTARDLAVLSHHLIHDFPEYYPIFKEKEFTWNKDARGKAITQGNRNPLLYKNLGADGLKTGHTQEAGYGLTASAVRDGRRLILVLNGMASMNERSRESERLLDWGFREFNNYVLFKSGEKVEDAQVWLGEQPTVSLVATRDMTVTLSRKARVGMKVSLVYDGPLKAPVAKGTPVGNLVITAPDSKTIELPVVTGEDVAPLGPGKRLIAALKYLVFGKSKT